MNRKIIIGGGYCRYEIIDMAKAFSIFQMYMRHIPSIISIVASVGSTGVQIFIFCSGFGLYLSQIRYPVNYKEFIVHRFLKIYIPYVCIVLITSVVPYMYSGMDRIVALCSHIFLFKMFVPQYTESFGVQFWFISTIIQFYVLFQPICWLKQKLGKKFFLILSLAISIYWWILITVLGKTSIRIWNSCIFKFFWIFVLGMIVAEYLNDDGEVCFKVKHVVLGIVIGHGIQAIMGLKGGAFQNFNDIPAAIGFGCTIILLFYLLSLKNSVSDFLDRILMAISRISYEWYLVHIIVFSTVFHFMQSQSLVSDILIGTIALALSLLTAYIYSVIIKMVSNFLKTAI